MYKEHFTRNEQMVLEDKWPKRNKVVRQGEIKLYDCHEERYCSFFSFDESILSHIKVHDTVGGFKGNYFCDVIWFDIDNKDLEVAKKDAEDLIANLNTKYNVSPDELFIYFSGSKGFHVAMVSKFWGEFQPSPTLPARIKLLAFAVASPIKLDEKIYEGQRIFRIVNSRHGKTGLYKVEITYDELKLSVEQIKELAKAPRKVERSKSFNDIHKNDLLVAEWDDVNRNFGEIVHHENETGKNFFSPATDGDRHTHLYKQAAMLFDKSELSSGAIYDIMYAMNQLCSPPITDLKELVDSARKKTAKNVKKKEDLIIKPFAGWIDELIDFIYHPTTNLTLGLDNFDHVLRKKYKGKLGCIVGYGGSKKSLLALNCAIKNIELNSSHVIYSTMEMSTNQLLYRIIDIVVDGQETNASYEVEAQNRQWAETFLKDNVAPILGNKLYITQNSSLVGTDYNKLIERYIGETGRCDILIVDGLSMMGGDGKETERYSDNTKELKEIANKWNILVIAICHVSKGADKHTRDLTDKVRGSEKIFDNCDFIITLSQLLDPVKSSPEIIEYLQDKGYARLYDKRGSGHTVNKIFNFNSKKLIIEESFENPANYEHSSKSKSSTFNDF